jgi:dipeptidyl aminopeptidase/acylaminoacyl peptidase
MRRHALFITALGLVLALSASVPIVVAAQGQPLPLRQSRLTRQTAGPPLQVDLDAAAHDDRWLGSGIRFRDMEGAEDVRWSLDSRWLYFQWNADPKPGDDPEADPWFRVDRDGRRAERMSDTEALTIPAAHLSWSTKGDRAAWTSAGRVYFFDAATATTRLAYAASEPVRIVRMRPDGRAVDPGAAVTRVTESGTDNFYRHPLVRLATVSFPLPSDGKPAWANVYDPPPAKHNGAAVVHIHGGGYRQFTRHGYSVYGWAIHLGLIHYLVAQGYTVLDLDYRGSSGYGRDYRTDIYQWMGGKDVEGGVAAVDWLVRERGIDRGRVGIYGLSYGGFFTLMALFTHPGVFAAGVANAAVGDWAHYSEEWTSRVLGEPATDPDACARRVATFFDRHLRAR